MSSDFSDAARPEDNTCPNPNKHRYEIVHVSYHGHMAIMFVRYPDCTTYNGNKVLVLEATDKDVEKLVTLDPHFLGGQFSPIARFPGDPAGFAQAVAYAKYHLDSNLVWYVVSLADSKTTGPFRTRYQASLAANAQPGSYVKLDVEHKTCEHRPGL